MRPEPHRDFQRLLQALTEHAASAETPDTETPLFRPGSEPLNPSDIDQVREAFSRTAINDEGEEAFFRGSLGTRVGATIQADYMAQAERAYMFLRMSKPRARAHAVARRRGHGSEQGVFSGEILQHVQDVLASG